MTRQVRVCIVVLCAVAHAWGIVPGAMAQEPVRDTGDGMPRFLLASTDRAAPRVVDARSLPVLRRRISVAFQDVSLADALKVIAIKGHIQLNYSRDVVPLEHRVRLAANDITVAAVLTEVLLGLGVDVLVGTNQQVALMPHVRMVAVVAGGTVVGRVTDAKTGAPVVRAEVFADGAGVRAATDTGGRYRLADLNVGSYTVTARRMRRWG